MRSVGIRLGTEGKGQVLGDLQAIERTGVAAFDRVAARAKRSGEDAQQAIAKAERDIRKLETLMPGLNPGKLDMYAGVRNEVGKSAESSAAVFAAAYQQMENRAEALRRAIDPLYAAQKRFDVEIGEARTLMVAGVLSLDDYAKAAWRAHQGLEAASGGNDRVAVTGRKAGSSFAAAAPQIQDFFTQVSMGGNILNAFVVQGGQVAGQLQYAQGAAGNFARFLMGPWGVGIQVALMVFGPFISKLWEESEASKKAKEAAEQHRKAILDLADAQGKAIQTAQRKQAIDVANIKLELDATIATRKRTEAELQAARARLIGNRVTQANTGGTAAGLMSDVASVSARLEQQKIDDLTAALKTNASEIERLQKGFDLGFNRLVGMKVDDGATASSRLEAQYNAARADAMENLSGPRLAARLREINAIREREAAAIKESTAARKADTDTLSSSSVAKMLREALPGVHVTSTTRSAERNKAIGGAANSYHLRGNAIDFVPAGGMASMTKEDVKRIFQSRGIDVLEVLGPGDKGHSDHFHVAWTKSRFALDEFNDAAKRTQEELKLLAGIAQDARGVDVGAIIGAQRERYNAGVKAILGDEDPLAGKILSGQELVAANDVDREIEQRRFELGRERIQSLASFYQTVFTNGTGSIWDMFRQMGMRTLSDLLAKWTAGKGGDGAGGILGSVAGLFGGGSGAGDSALGASIAAQANASLPKLASGTEAWSGGAALLGEHGPEIASLPRGTRVTPAAQTRRMMAGNDNARGPLIVNVHADNAVLAETVRGWVAEGVAIAATNGAAGGAAMAEADNMAAAGRRLGRRW